MPTGPSAVNELSWAFLQAVRLVQYREPSILVRFFSGIDSAFWHASVAAMRDGLPVLAVNDDVLVPSRVHHGVRLPLAREYAHCACLNGHVPGHDLPPVSTYHNGPRLLLDTLEGPIDSCKELLRAFRLRLRGELEESARRMARRRGYYPLAAWPLFEGHLQAGERYFERTTTFSDQRFVGLATVVDSLLATREVVFERQLVTMDELRSAMADNFASRGDLLGFIRHRTLTYGQDEPTVLALITQISQMWVEEVEQVGAAMISIGVRLIPSFYSWLTNIEMGAPDPRHAQRAAGR